MDVSIGQEIGENSFQMSDIENAKKLFFEALALIDLSDFQNAELRLREALPFSPGSVSILTNLAVVLLRQDKRSEACEFAEKAISTKADNIEAMMVLVDCYAKDNKLTEALAVSKNIISLNPNIFETHNNIGLIFQKLGRFKDALDSYDRAIALESNRADPHLNRGNTLRHLRRYDEALAAYDKALALKPDLVGAWHGRGDAFSDLLRFDEARAAYRRALTQKPDSLGALRALALLSLSEGNIAEAFDLAQRALAVSDTPETKSLVAWCLRSSLVNPSMGDLRGLLLRALSEPWARPSELGPACARFLLLNNAIRDCMARAMQAWPKLLSAEALAGSSSLAKVAEDPLFRALLESTPVFEVALERFATGLRFNLLTAARSAVDGDVTAPVLSLYCAIARQCFINNYVFAQSDAEIEQALALRDALVTALASGAAIPALSLVAVAAYVPLHSLADAEALLHLQWPEAVSALLAQQVRAPIEEQRLRASMPVLTAISDDVSILVRGQYEENPYPQWVKVVSADSPETVDVIMREKFPLSAFVELDKQGGIDILIAGCGTGQQSIETARQFKDAQVLAIDLSLSSLCYAQRQTHALGLNNIHYAQADIMNLRSLGRTFDVIEAIGVLHHLADPFAGWRVLLSLLRPNGIMRLGFYSETARRDIVAVRDFIAARGYRPFADDIRRCRQELFDSADGTPLKNVTSALDFFSLSECRDLLFHIQEHRLSLPEITAFLAENNLRFLGFDLELRTRRNYARQFPGDIPMTDLAQWHRYETANPRTFVGMYQFCVQRK